eukprot:COSAG02_NODE_33330_length_501_cov_5.276119_1_plen_87_part_01
MDSEFQQAARDPGALFRRSAVCEGVVTLFPPILQILPERAPSLALPLARGDLQYYGGRDEREISGLATGGVVATRSSEAPSVAGWRC